MRRSALSYGLALFLWLACAYELLVLAVLAVRGTVGEARFVGRLLAQPDAADRAVPIAVVVVFAWILSQVLARAVGIAREQAAVKVFDGPGRPPDRLRAGHRARAIREHSAAAPGKLAEVLPAASALDAAALDNSYALLKALVWTLPVLGFIGTAWGMSHAIAGFSEALAFEGGGAPPIEVVTDRLAQVVIPGLANAFAITMLALGAAVISHLWVVTLQSWDLDALEQLDRASIEALAAVTPAHPAGGLPAHLVPVLVQSLGAVTEELRTLNGKLDLAAAGERLQGAAGGLEAAARALGEAAGQIQSSTRAPYHITIRREAGDGR
jgi:biopolymer transport protein ExbB/TolQ